MGTKVKILQIHLAAHAWKEAWRGQHKRLGTLQGRQDGWSQSQDQPVVPTLAGMAVGVLGGAEPRPGIKTSKFTTCDHVVGLPMQS